MKETKSKVLADYAQEQGFRVTRGVAEIPTVAEYGSGLPIIDLVNLMRYLDFLKSTNYKEVLNSGAAGHGCGHMFGAGSLGCTSH
jgi:aminobenzoyl-glutamate utilization protein B